MLRTETMFRINCVRLIVYWFLIVFAAFIFVAWQQPEPDAPIADRATFEIGRIAAELPDSSRTGSRGSGKSNGK